MAGGERKPKGKGPLLDRAIRSVAPQWAAHRQRARIMLAVGDGWDVTRSDRRRRKGAMSGGSADKHLTARRLGQLRELCRHHDRNGSVFAGMLNRAVDNVLGPQFTWQAATADETLNRDVDAYLAERSQATRADARGTHDLADLMGLALRAMWTDGDYLPIHQRDGGLAVYEGDQLVTPRSGQKVAGRSIRNGVEVDPKTGRPRAFWVASRSFRGWVDTLRDAQRIDARDAVWLMNAKRISQTRGVPELASPLALYDRLDGYVDNESMAAEVNAMLAFFIEREPPYPTTATLPPGQTKQTKTDGTVEVLQQLKTGSIVTVRPGNKVKPFAAERPGSNFQPYVWAVGSMIGAAVGMPLILVFLDFSKVNYSSARAALLEARRAFRRWQKFIEKRALRPVLQRWIGQGIADGTFPAREDIFDLQIHFPGWEWVDPLKEVEADIGAIRAGLDTWSRVTEKRGINFRELCRRRRSDEKVLRDFGVEAHLQDVTFPPAAGAGDDDPDMRRGTRESDE